MILGITGHRQLGGYNIPNPTYNYVRNEIIKQFEILKPDVVITGFAIGADQLAAEICLEMKITYHAYCPFLGQEKLWPEFVRKRYNELLEKAAKVEIISNGGYAGWKMQVRNCRIVDDSEKMLAIFNGSVGGTKNCVDYAKSKNKEIIIINPNNHT